MDRPFYLLLGAAAVISFGTVWMATGVANAPLPAPIIVEAPAPLPSGPANPNAASPLTVPVRVDTSVAPMGQGSTSSTGSGPIDPTPALTLRSDTPSSSPVPQQVAPDQAPPVADVGGVPVTGTGPTPNAS